MKYYAVKSDVADLMDRDAYICSEKELSEFDLLVIDSEGHGFVTCSILKEISQFDAISLPFEISSYLMRMNIENYMKKKKAESRADTILKKVESKVKEIQYLEKLRKYSKDSKVKALLEEYDALHEEDEETYQDNVEVNPYDPMTMTKD